MAPRSIMAAMAIALFLFGTTTARSQNFEGPGLLRFGVFGQAGFFDADSTTDAEATARGELDRGGLGVSFGYDWRMDRLMVGLEADVATINGDVDGPAGTEVSLDYMSTFRARFGAFARPGVLVYGTAGAAVLNTQYERPGVRKQGNLVDGWVAGAGVEVDWHDMLWFAEYLHADFGGDRLKSDADSLKFDASTHLARVGLKFKIGFDY